MVVLFPERFAYLKLAIDEVVVPLDKFPILAFVPH
jgi:hypothetical protein